MNPGLNQLTYILILGITTWRLARIIPIDDVAEPIRTKITMYTYPETEITERNQLIREWIGRLLSCTVCLSVWVAPLVVLFWSLVVARCVAGLAVPDLVVGCGRCRGDRFALGAVTPGQTRDNTDRPGAAWLGVAWQG